MNPNEYISTIYKQIEKNNISPAVDGLKKLLENSPKLNELLLQSSRYNDVLKQIRLGLIDFESGTVTKNKIKLALLELVNEVKKQEQNSIINDELVEAISIIHSKNVVTGNIAAGGDVNIGDQTIYTESKTSKWLGLILFLFVPMLVIGVAYFWYQNEELKKPLSLKVLIENKTPNPNLSEPVGKLSLTYGGVLESKEGITSESYFENIPSSFRKDSFRLQFFAEGFFQVDTFFKYTKSVILPTRRNFDLSFLKGFVYQETKGSLKPVEGVKVEIDCCSVFTDVAGKFILKIPFEHQRKEHRLTFSKESFRQKSIIEPVIKDATLRTYLVKSKDFQK